MSLLTELDALFAARLGRGAVREGLSDEGLCPLSAADSASLVAAFRQGLRALGDAEGRPFPPSSCDTRMGVPNVPDLAANWSGPKSTSSATSA